MPNFQTDLAAKVGLNGSAGLTDATRYQGSVRYMLATLVILTSMTANDTFDIGPPLPPGARVLPHLSRFLCHGDPGVTLTVDIGDAADPDRYCDGAVLQNSGDVFFCAPVIPAGVINPVKLAVPTAITGVIATAGTLTNNTKIDILIAYVVG